MIAPYIASGTFAVDDQYVYAFTYDDALVGYPKAGGAGTTVIGGINTTLDSWLQADANNLYWMVYDAPTVIISAPKMGGATKVLNQPSPDIPIRRLQQDVDHLYWLGDVDVAVADKSGGARRLVSMPRNLQDPLDLAVDTDSVYWVMKGGSSASLWRAAKSGGDPVEVASWMDSGAGYLALDADAVYLGGSVVRRIDKATGALSTIYPRPDSPGNPDWIGFIAVDGTHLYMSTLSSATKLSYLVRTQKDGSDARVLDDADSSYVVVQGDSVYYGAMTTMNGNQYPGIKRICK